MPAFNVKVASNAGMDSIQINSVFAIACHSGWSGLTLERGGHVCKPKGGLASRALTNPSKTTRLSQMSPLSVIQPALR